MSETETKDAANGELADAVSQATPVEGVPMKDGVAYMMVPAPLMVELVKILGKLPFDEVERVMVGLRKCPPVRRNRPEAPAE